MFTEKIKALTKKMEGGENKKKIENLVVFLIILIITIIAINVIWKDEKTENKSNNILDSNKKLATQTIQPTEETTIQTSEETMAQNLENILSKINGVGEVEVLITYSQTSQTIPLYNEDSSQKDTEETDKQGGNRKITETDTKKEIIYQEVDGEKVPITQSVISPIIEGAIITAKGASNATIKANIVQAVEAATGLATHKIQVFEMAN